MKQQRAKPAGLIRCIYCGETAKSSKEHVVQNAIGGVDCITDVCQPCNHGMKDIDEELAVRSGLAILAIRELGETGPKMWVHDPQRPGLILESHGSEGTDSLTLHPQIVFDGDSIQLHCSAEELQLLGAETHRRIFYERLRGAYDHFRQFGPNAKRKNHRGKDMLKIQRIERLMPGERLPPRIFCRTPVSKFKPELIFELRYHNEGDDQIVLDKLSKFDWNPTDVRADLVMGAENGTVAFPTCLTHVLRALAKIGFNLLAFHCRKTPVSLDTFPHTVDWITGRRDVPEFHNIQKFGFVHPADLADLRCPPRAHKFRLAHDPTTNTWKLYAAFFGGQAGAYVEFHGPNHEDWATMEVVSPYEKPFDAPVFDKWFRPLDVRITLELTEMLPSVEWTKTDGRLELTPIAT